MKEYINKIINRNGLRLSLLIIIALVILNAVLVIFYRNIITKNYEFVNHIREVNLQLGDITDHIHLADLGVRAYIIHQTEALLSPFEQAKETYEENLNLIQDNLESLGYDMNQMIPARKAIGEYIQVCQLMADLCTEGNVDEAIELFKEDRGYSTWQEYGTFVEDANNYLTKLQSTSERELTNSLNFLLILQLTLILLAVPILSIVYRKTRKDDKFRQNVFKRIDGSNRKYLFDPGKNDHEQNEDTIIDDLVTNLKKAANFINNITRGKFDVEWEGMDEKSAALNKNNIAGELIQMRGQMLKSKKDDEIRLWTNEGMSKFAALVREHQNDLSQLSEQLISNIVLYLNAHQGGLFFLNDDDENDPYLELMGCYAYHRKKFLVKRIEIGQSMVGQCFLEGETTYITNIPDEYVNITSGLGNTNPDTLLIVPLKINEEVVGVVEIASLNEFEKHQIEFLERIAEIIASAIVTVKRNDKNKVLLEQSQQQAEEMKSQEEEMRQNMEELQATQEQMHRKNEEVENLLEQAAENEEKMKGQLKQAEEQAEQMRAQEEEMKQNMEELQAAQEEMERKNKEVERLLKEAAENEESMKIQQMMLLEEQQILEIEDAILNTLMETIPDRVTVKDKEGKYLKVSDSKFKSLKEQGFDEVIGKSDKDMFGASHFEKSYADEKKIMKTQKATLNTEEKIKISKNKTIWGSTSRMPLKNKDGSVLGTVVITRDITELKQLSEELKKLKKES